LNAGGSHLTSTAVEGVSTIPRGECGNYQLLVWGAFSTDDNVLPQTLLGTCLCLWIQFRKSLLRFRLSKNRNLGFLRQRNKTIPFAVRLRRLSLALRATMALFRSLWRPFADDGAPCLCEPNALVSRIDSSQIRYLDPPKERTLPTWGCPRNWRGSSFLLRCWRPTTAAPGTGSVRWAKTPALPTAGGCH